MKLPFPGNNLYVHCHSAEASSNDTYNLALFRALQSICTNFVWIYTHEIISTKMEEQEKDLLLK